MEDTQANMLYERFQRLEEMIERTSQILKSLVENQGNAIRVEYSQKTVYMVLSQITDVHGKCCGVRWSKFKFVNSNRVWINSRKVGQKNVAVMEKMDVQGRYKYKEITDIVKKTTSVRNDLMTKKKSIMGTLQSLGQGNKNEKSLQEIEKKFESFLL